MDNDVASTGGMPPPLGAPNAPPVLTRPAVPPNRKGGRGWMILAIVMGVFLMVSLAGNFQRLLNGIVLRSRTVKADRWLQEVTLENNRSRNKIAVIDVSGIIFGEATGRGRSMVDLISDQLDLAGEDDAVKGVILRVDSPGGEVLASDEIYRAISRFQDEHKKPVVASMGGVAASGGYYVSAPCRWIVANELTITGSIGVIMHSYNYRGLMNKVGVRPEVFKSGRFKDMLSGEKAEEEVLPEERKMVQELVDETFVRFKSVVKEGREFAEGLNGSEGRKLIENWEDLADGRVLSGKQAYEYGFVDELGNFETAVDRVHKFTHISNANLVSYQQPFDLGSLFRLFGSTESRTLKIDLGLEFPKVQAGRLYYLSPTLLY
jgi:protease-4